MREKEQQSTLVTGASGFIGQHVFSYLKNLDFNLVAFDRNDLKTPSLFDLHSLKQYCLEKEISAIVHLASRVKNIRSNHDIDDEVSIAVNLLSTLKPGCLFIYFSTADVYADSSDILHEDSCLNPSSAYSKAKSKAEKELVNLASLNGVSLVILRPSLVYGSGLPAGMFLSDLSKSLSDGLTFSYSSRPIVRDLIHVHDVASAVAKILRQKNTTTGIYNLSTGIATSLSEIVRKVESIIGRELSTQRDASKGFGSPRVIVLNSQRLQTEIDWCPSVSIENGLKDFFRE